MAGPLLKADMAELADYLDSLYPPERDTEEPDMDDDEEQRPL